MTTIPQKDLRNSIGEVLRRVESGEEITVTVAGRPSVELRPAAARRWVGGAALDAVFRGPAPSGFDDDLQQLHAGVTDPFPM